MLAFTKRESAIVGVATFVGLCVGSEISFVWAKKRYKKIYFDIANEEIAKSKVYYSELYKKERLATPQALLDLRKAQTDSVDVLDPNEELPVEAPAVEIQSVTNIVNIFESPERVVDVFNYREEVKSRTPDRPYVISKDEFFENEKEFEQISITWFDEDEVLVDRRDEPISDVDGMIGKDNIRFGFGSQDPNLVYIRNETIGADFEVSLSQGKYTKEVLGFDDAIEHGERRGKSRRFRDDDERTPR